MIIEIPLPSLGDDDDAVRGGRVSELLVTPGEHVNKGGDLLELITDKAAFVVPSPESGVVESWQVAEGDTIAVGQVMCLLDADA